MRREKCDDYCPFLQGVFHPLRELLQFFIGRRTSLPYPEISEDSFATQARNAFRDRAALSLQGAPPPVQIHQTPPVDLSENHDGT